MVQFVWSERIELTDANVSTIPDNKAGVYRLMTRKQLADEYPIIYVGRSEDLKKRLLEHMSDGEENECLKEKIAKLSVWYRMAFSASEEDRENAEFTMYHKYNPTCNAVAPSGRTIDMNFV